MSGASSSTGYSACSTTKHRGGCSSRSIPGLACSSSGRGGGIRRSAGNWRIETVGEIVGIFTATSAGAPMQPLAEATVESGRGIVGDRYHAGAGEFSQKLRADGRGDWQITLIESEE